jgi:hypothetical protein
MTPRQSRPRQSPPRQSPRGQTPRGQTPRGQSPRGQRLATHLIRLASSRLPARDREDRYREWIAELHAIAHDPGTASRARRGARALLYAADQNRGVRQLRQRPDSQAPHLPPRPRALRRRPGPIARSLILAVAMLTELTMTWIHTHDVRAFAVTAVMTAGVYLWAVARIMRRADPHFLENPEDKEY